MRRKPPMNGSGSGYTNNQNRKPRYNGGSGNGEHRSQNTMNHSGHHSSQGRPRKNYTASREKYLTQARDALAAGDRILAENYFQHADHCYRMMVEEGYNQRNHYTPPPANDETPSASQQEGQSDHAQDADQQMAPNGNQTAALPAFLTGHYEASDAPSPGAAPLVQNWDEQ